MRTLAILLALLLLAACTRAVAAPASEPPPQEGPAPSPRVPAECDAQTVSLSASLDTHGKVQIQAIGLQPGEAVHLDYYQSGGENHIIEVSPGKVAGRDGVFTWISSLEPGTWLIQLHSQDGGACATVTVK